MHEFELIETSVLAALAPLKNQGVKTLEILAGQLDAKDLQKITRNFPFVYVKAGNLDSETKNRLENVEVPVVLLVGDKNTRGGNTPTMGDNLSPGVYEILTAIKTLLHRQVVVKGWEWLLRTREEEVAYDPDKNVCIYAAWYRAGRRQA